MVPLLSSTRKRVVGQLIATPTLRPSLSHISNTPKQIFLRASRPRALSRSMCALDSAFQCDSVLNAAVGSAGGYLWNIFSSRAINLISVKRSRTSLLGGRPPPLLPAPLPLSATSSALACSRVGR
jgi:hypothetical protein